MAAQMQAFAPPNMSPTPAARQPSQQIHSIPAQNTVEAWCQTYGLGAEECQSLIKLDFKVGDKLDALSDTIWEWAAVPPLRRIRILDAYTASKERATSN
jgi:hypothetical protein